MGLVEIMGARNPNSLAAISAMIAMASCVTASLTHAQTAMDTRNLLEICQAPALEWVGFCAGFIQAANDQAVAVGSACVEAGTTRADLIDAFVAYSDAALFVDPQLGLDTALATAVSAISDAYPCT